MTYAATTPTVVDLADARDTNDYGNKAATLAQLLAAGLPVPPGRVLPAHTTDAELPAAVADLCDWARTRDDHLLVIRSSASGEDSATTSFAGLYTSVFTPVSYATVRNALRRVRGSRRSTDAYDYARARGVTSNQAMAVLIQSALRPVAAGVVAAELTREGELTNWRIEAVRGLAEPLTAGRCIGETHTGATFDGEITVTPADQCTIVVPGTTHELTLPPGEWTHAPVPGGTTPAKVATSAHGLVHLHTPPEWINTAALSAAQRTALLDMTVRAAAVLDFEGIDVEWAIDSADNLALLQARPLTATLPPAVSIGGQRRGIPAAPGIGHGPVIHLDADIPDVAGAVLVCGPLGPDAVPTLLQRPAAIIATSGGPLCHTAIIARELSIPCVTAVPQAHSIFKPGSTVYVNGTTGAITSTDPDSPRRAKPVDPSHTAVLTASPGKATPDGRLVTLQLHQPDTPQSIPPGAALGLFQATCQPPWPERPPGFRDLTLPHLGRFLLPTDRPIPHRIAVLSPHGTVLHQRPLRVGAPPSHIVWDWNGTLLDDNTATLAAVNAVCADHNRAAVDLNGWRAIFRRPPKQAYEKLLGTTLTNDQWQHIEQTFHAHYRRLLPDCHLATDARFALRTWTGSNRTQSLLSMTPHDLLTEAITDHGLSANFTIVQGRTDTTTATKAAHLEEHLSAQGVEPTTAVVIGDNDDDAHAARTAGTQVILIATGTMSRARLEASGAPTVDSLTDALQLLC